MYAIQAVVLLAKSRERIAARTSWQMSNHTGSLLHRKNRLTNNLRLDPLLLAKSSTAMTLEEGSDAIDAEVCGAAALGTRHDDWIS